MRIAVLLTIFFTEDILRPDIMKKRNIENTSAKEKNKKKSKVKVKSKNNTTKKTSPRKKKNSKVSFDFTKAGAGFLLFIIISALVFFLTPPKENKSFIKFDEDEIQSFYEAEESNRLIEKDNDIKNNNQVFNKNYVSEKQKTDRSENLPPQGQEKPKTGFKTVGDKKQNKDYSFKIPKNEASIKKNSSMQDKEDLIAMGVPELPVLHKGILFFVFDDAGHNTTQLRHFLDLPFKCTIAVLPRLSKSKECAELTRLAGKEVILHQPMQAENPDIDPGGGAIKKGMSIEQIKKITVENIEEIAPIAGMNNHEGSLITANEYAMSAVLEAVREKGIFFLDSRTTPRSAASKAAAALNMRIFERDVFIDNEKNIEYMRNQIIEGLKIAQKKGHAVMIGHVFTVQLASLLKEMYYDLEKEGYEFSVLSEYY